MKLSELIAELQETLNINGDMDVVGMIDGIVYPYIEINCPDSESPVYIEFYKDYVHYFGEVHRITLGKCEGTNRKITKSHCLYKLLFAGEFDWCN